MRNTAKRHAHLRALTKAPAKLQKDTGKTVGVAFTRFCDGQSDAGTDRRMHGKNNMSPDTDGVRHN